LFWNENPSNQQKQQNQGESERMGGERQGTPLSLSSRTLLPILLFL
jgi:hypothetical protein